ncbi:MAG: sigma-54 dependent transcriptional regulator [Smithellaceae bacterium]|nr:sigma-54 dependent transcriptional regulator [Smithellaceae bacterium]
MAERLLIVDDEETLCESLGRVLSREGYEVRTAESVESAIQALDEGYYDLILTDIILPGVTGIEFLKRIKERSPEQSVVVMTAFASLETAIDALRNGAYDYIVKPLMHEEIKLVVKNALKQNALQEENLRLRSQLEKEYAPARIVAQSAAMKKIMNQVREIANADKNVLLLGERGTGKELIARAIHFYSGRADKPFIPVALHLISEEVRESRLFGTIKGFVKNGTVSKKGILGEVGRGTLFLREVGGLDSALQARLLKAIEDRETIPPGGTRGLKVDCAFIYASHTEADILTRESQFLAALSGKINAATIMLPPLRERHEDIPPLVNHFLQKYSADLCKTVKGIDPEGMDLLAGYHWPGNVRELKNIIERAVLMLDGHVIRAEHLPGLKTEVDRVKAEG